METNWQWRKFEQSGAVTEWTLEGPSVLCRFWYDGPPDKDAALVAAAPELYEALEHALRDTEGRLYMLPIEGRGVSEQKDILSAQIGRYKSALKKARGEQ